MPCSAARIEANRRNAQKSTGPRTPEGKAVSRQNATRHGLAASADLLGPLDDAGLVEGRAEALAGELGATSLAGRLLARRAALLSVRMERLAGRDEAATRERMAHAVEEVDAARRLKLGRLIHELASVGPGRPLAVHYLWAAPDGVAGVLDFADGLVADLALGGEPAALARRRALGWLDLEAAVEPELGSIEDNDDEALLERIAAEGARWEARALELAPEAGRLDEWRRRVALGAAFDPGPEAHQARRYEAAAERGFYRALQAIRQLGRDAEATLDDAVATTEAAAEPTESTQADAPSLPEPASEPAPTRALGSFGAEGASARFELIETDPSAPPHPPIDPQARRRNRPDPLRLVAGGR